ncbi:MAG TPA: hypothetical protein VFB19_12800 [Mycobacterium sp.]|nr:hypothetical protein [Mycobacterium sp.]
MSAFSLPIAVLAAAAGAVVSIALAGPAAALPQCTNTGPMTTQCERPGNAQINTAPPANNNNYPWGWPWWGTSGISISIG